MVVTVSPIEAEIWADTVQAVNTVVVAVKVPVVWPAAIVMQLGESVIVFTPLVTVVENRVVPSALETLPFCG